MSPIRLAAGVEDALLAERTLPGHVTRFTPTTPTDLIDEWTEGVDTAATHRHARWPQGWQAWQLNRAVHDFDVTLDIDEEDRP